MPVSLGCLKPGVNSVEFTSKETHHDAPNYSCVFRRAGHPAMPRELTCDACGGTFRGTLAECQCRECDRAACPACARRIDDELTCPFCAPPRPAPSSAAHAPKSTRKDRR